jgi:hypothetical protein
MEEESDNNVDPETENVPFGNETNEEKIVRLDISRMILKCANVKKIKQLYPNYYSKEKTMIGLAHLFHANHTGNDHPFFFGMVYKKAVKVQNHDPLTEKDLIGKIVNVLLASYKPLEYIKERFSEYFNSHLQHIGFYGNYCNAKKMFDAKFRAHMNFYDSIVSFTPNDLNLLLSSYEERL